MEILPEIKILVCSNDKHCVEQLQKLLQQSNRHFIFVETDFENCKWRSDAYLPDLMILDMNAWYQQDKYKIDQLREHDNTPLILWAEEASEKIMTAVFNLSNICFIKKTDKKEVLIDIISKSVCSANQSEKQNFNKQ